jgi:hypothetical protein
MSKEKTIKDKLGRSLCLGDKVLLAINRYSGGAPMLATANCIKILAQGVTFRICSTGNIYKLPRLYVSNRVVKIT